MQRALILARGFLEGMKRWRYGVRTLTMDDLRKIRQIRSGMLIHVRPKHRQMPLVDSLPNAFLPLWLLRKSSFAFEIWGQHGEPQFYLWASDRVALRELEAQFRAVYSKAEFSPSGSNHPELDKSHLVCTAGMVLEGEPFGLKTVGSFRYDPLSHLLELTRQCDCMVQVMFRPLKKLPRKLKPWVFDTLSHRSHQPLRMTGIPLFETVIRIVTISEDPIKARETLELITDSFIILGGRFSWLRPKMTSFRIPVVRDHLLEHLIRRDFPRSSGRKMVLNIPELAALVHLPPETDVMGVPSQLKPASDSSIALGHSTAGGQRRLVGLPAEDLGNTYICGSPGTGKTTMLINLAIQSLDSGYCCWLIDPHGDMADDLIRSLHPSQLDRVVFLDPYEVQFSLNPLELPAFSGEAEKESAVERIVGEVTDMIQKLFGRHYWGPSLNRTFQNSLRALYSFSNSPTFEDMRRVLLGEEDFGSKDVREFQQEMARLPRERLDAVLNKIDPFVRNQTLNRLFCRNSTLDLDELMQPSKLVVWRLSKAKLTGPALNMAGAAIVTRLWFYVAARPREERNPVMFMIDEFQNFAGLETLGIMLAEGRKYQIQLVLAHQHLQQLRQQVSVEDVLANTMTKIAFRVSGEDAAVLARTFDPSRARDLVSKLTSLPNGRALVKLRAGFDAEHTPCFEISTLPPPEKRFVDLMGLIQLSRERYTVTKAKKEEAAEKAGVLVTDLLRIVRELEEQGEEPMISTILKRFTPKVQRGSDLSRIIDRAQRLGLVDRQVVRGTKGRPRIVARLTEKAKDVSGAESDTVIVEDALSLGGAKAGGELHRSLIIKVARLYEEEGYKVEIPEQAGRETQPDLVVYPEENGSESFAVEIETSAKHPEQIEKNYLKNVEKGRQVVFMVPDEGTGERLERVLKTRGIEAPVYVLEEDDDDDNDNGVGGESNGI